MGAVQNKNKAASQREIDHLLEVVRTSRPTRLNLSQNPLTKGKFLHFSG